MAKINAGLLNVPRFKTGGIAIPSVKQFATGGGVNISSPAFNASDSTKTVKYSFSLNLGRKEIGDFTGSQASIAELLTELEYAQRAV